MQTQARRRGERKGLVDERLRLVQVAALQGTGREAEERLGTVRLEPPTLGECLLGLRNVRLAEETVSQQQTGLEVVGRRPKNGEKIEPRSLKLPRFHQHATAAEKQVLIVRRGLEEARVRRCGLGPETEAGVPVGQRAQYFEVARSFLEHRVEQTLRMREVFACFQQGLVAAALARRQTELPGAQQGGSCLVV